MNVAWVCIYLFSNNFVIPNNITLKSLKMCVYLSLFLPHELGNFLVIFLIGCGGNSTLGQLTLLLCNFHLIYVITRLRLVEERLWPSHATPPSIYTQSALGHGNDYNLECH